MHILARYLPIISEPRSPDAGQYLACTYDALVDGARHTSRDHRGDNDDYKWKAGQNNRKQVQR